MKPEEAIKILEVAKAECEWNAPLEYQAAFDAAFEALEKQIPMKHLPYEIGENGRIIYPCGNCGEDVKGYDFCPWCGQRIGGE
jgi:rubrerythrin